MAAESFGVGLKLLAPAATGLFPVCRAHFGMAGVLRLQNSRDILADGRMTTMTRAADGSELMRMPFAP